MCHKGSFVWRMGELETRDIHAHLTLGNTLLLLGHIHIVAAVAAVSFRAWPVACLETQAVSYPVPSSAQHPSVVAGHVRPVFQSENTP